MYFSRNCRCNQTDLITASYRGETQYSVKKSKSKPDSSWSHHITVETSSPHVNVTLQRRNRDTSFLFFSGLPPPTPNPVIRWQPSHHYQYRLLRTLLRLWALPPLTYQHLVLSHLQENRRTSGPQPRLLISTFTRNHHKEDVRRSLYCGFHVWWVVRHLCFDSERLQRWDSNCCYCLTLYSLSFRICRRTARYLRLSLNLLLL